MNLSEADESVDHTKALIEWNTPEMVQSSSCHDNCINNPFDLMELRANSMDPFDLDPNQTPPKQDPSCGFMLSPLWELKVRRIKKSVSLIDLSSVAKVLEQKYEKTANDDIVKDQSKDHHSIDIVECVDQSNKDCISVHNVENKTETNQEQNIESISTLDNNEINLETTSLCNEEEKKQIREQTRQRIQMLIEKQKQIYEEKCSREALFCTPQRKLTSELNKSDSLFNKGFVQNDSDSTSNITLSKTSEITGNINDNNNTSNTSSVFPACELNSFDLDSLRPEWVVDNFSDTDGSIDVSTKDKLMNIVPSTYNNNQVDKLKALKCIGTFESKPNQTILKSVQNKRIQNKGPFLANIPLQHMVHDYKESEIEEINSQSPGQIKPVASSTPTLDNVDISKTPSKNETIVKSRSSLSRRSFPNSISPSTPLNVTKCIKKKSNNTFIKTGFNVHQENVCSNSLYKRANSDSIIGNLPKPMVTNINKISSLPVPKRFCIPYKGKENMKPQ